MGGSDRTLHLAIGVGQRWYLHAGEQLNAHVGEAEVFCQLSMLCEALVFKNVEGLWEGMIE